MASDEWVTRTKITEAVYVLGGALMTCKGQAVTHQGPRVFNAENTIIRG